MLVCKRASMFSVSTSFLCPHQREGCCASEGQESCPFPGLALCPSSGMWYLWWSRGNSALLLCTLTAVSASCPHILVKLFAASVVLQFFGLDVCYASKFRLTPLKRQLGIRHPRPRRFAGICSVAKLGFGDAVGVFHTCGMDFCSFFPGAVNVLWKPETADFLQSPGYASPFILAIYDKTWFMIWQSLIPAISNSFYFV